MFKYKAPIAPFENDLARPYFGEVSCVFRADGGTRKAEASFRYVLHLAVDASSVWKMRATFFTMWQGRPPQK